MKRDNRLSTVLHALLHLSEQDRPMTSDALAACIGANPAVVRRTMAGLRQAGLVRSDRGHGGGWRLDRALDTVTLRDIHAMIGAPGLFAIGNKTAEPACLVEQAVNHALDDALRQAEALLLQRFAGVSLAVLAADFRARLDARSVRTPGAVHAA